MTLNAAELHAAEWLLCTRVTGGANPTCRGNCGLQEDRSGFFLDVVLPSRQQVSGGGLVAVPIGGGGYCYCDAMCNAKLYFGYTDNNSYGGCCADWAQECSGVARDVDCMDARTQAQAVNLFVAHHTVLQLVTTS